MLSEAVREALLVEREKVPGKQTSTDSTAKDSQSGSSKRGGYNKGIATGCQDFIG